jgi:hypothetical protein
VGQSATGLHVLARLVPALHMTIARRLGPDASLRPPRSVPGRARRVGAVTLTLAVAAVAAAVAGGGRRERLAQPDPLRPSVRISKR